MCKKNEKKKERRKRKKEKSKKKNKGKKNESTIIINHGAERNENKHWLV